MEIYIYKQLYKYIPYDYIDYIHKYKGSRLFNIINFYLLFSNIKSFEIKSKWRLSFMINKYDIFAVSIPKTPRKYYITSYENYNIQININNIIIYNKDGKLNEETKYITLGQINF